MIWYKEERQRPPIGILAKSLTLSCIFICSVLQADSTRLEQTYSKHNFKNFLESYSEASIFLSALKQSDHWDSISNSEARTIFVPTNDALRSEGSAFLLEVVLGKPENKERLDQLIAIHMRHSIVDQKFLKPMANNNCFDLSMDAESMKIGSQTNVTGIVKVADGMIYFIDHLLWEPYNKQKECS